MVCDRTTQSACHHAHVAERQDSDREVLTSLPRTRPVRRSAKRGDRPDTKTAAKAPPRRAAAAKPRAAKATAAKPPAGAAKSKAAAGTKAAAGARAASSAPKRTRSNAERPRVAPTRKVPPAGYASPSSRADEPAASGTAELLTTTLQAAAELAQIGLTVGRQTLQSMFDRLPKP
jgi:hypothetical protein